MLVCRTTRAEDLPALARCHAQAFPRALSTRQGHRFIIRMLEWYLVAERGVLFHVEEGGAVVGYCGGIRTLRPGEPGAFTSITQHAFWSFVRAYLLRPWLLVHPENLQKRAAIWRNVRLRLGKAEAAVTTPATLASFRPRWGLVVIGVDPRVQGKGYGARLLQEFEDRARADGVGLVSLSVARANARAIRAYERQGWHIVDAGPDSLAMQKELTA